MDAMDITDVTDPERRDLLSTLTKHRGFLVHTLRGLSDADAGRCSTVSELSVGGIVKHVTQTESMWIDFVQRGGAAFPAWDDPGAFQARIDAFTMLPGDTVASVLDAYAQTAARTDALIASIPSLDASQPLPEAPWFEPGEWSARRVVLHLIAETAQHAGHADIIREAIDGRKTMG
jgi:hypothetical protein